MNFSSKKRPREKLYNNFPQMSNYSVIRSVRALRPLRALKRMPGMPVMINSLLASLPKVRALSRY